MATTRTSRAASTGRSSARSVPHKPAGVKEPQDHLPPAGEREPATMVIEWGGLEFEIFADPDDFDFFTVTAPLSQGNIAAGLVGILGDAQLIELRKAYPKFNQRQARELYETINAALGFGKSGN